MSETTAKAAPHEPQSSTFRLGHLLSPPEFAAACASLVQRPQLACWAIATALPDSLARRLELSGPGNVGCSLSILKSARGVYYPTVVLQAKSCQLRVALSLSDERVLEWLTSVTSKGSVTVAVDVPEVAQLMVMDGACSLREPSAISAIARNSAQLGFTEDIADRFDVAMLLTEPEGCPTCLPGIAVDEVHLVFVKAKPPARDRASADPHPVRRTLN